MLGKKIPTLLALLLLIGVFVGLIIWQKSKGETVSAEVIPTGVKITNVADNKFSVSWTTKVATKGAVEYGSVGEKLELRAEDDRGSEHVGLTHHITVAGLQPGTNYAFRILSGSPERRFDNNGSVYSVNTGSTIASVPAARSLYGEVTGGSEDTLVYVTMPDAQPTSVTLKASGGYSVALSTIRSADLTSFVAYDPSATVVSLLLDNGVSQSQVTASTANISPVPTIALGQNADYRSVTSEPTQVAQVEPAPEPEETTTPQAVDIFNVEPIAGAEVNEVTNSKFTLTNPGIEGEVLATTKPAFSGTGPANVELTIAISGQKAVSDKVRVGASGSWSWTPAIALSLGKQKIAVSYVDNDDKTQKIERSFSVTATSVDSEPAFVSTPSASTTTTVSPSPRTGLPATESGVPVTGVMTPTLLTLGLSFAIMVVGAFLLAF